MRCGWRRVGWTVLAAGLYASSPQGAAAQVPIVYVRCPRADAEVEVSGEVTVAGERRRVSRTLRGFDGFDALPDVVRFLSDFTAPCDLVYREPDGTERILYDCTGTSTDEAACAAMDPAVSFDGRTVAFTVFRGELRGYRQNINARVLEPAAENALAENLEPASFPTMRLASREAQLHLVDVASGELTPLPFVEGEFDTGPAFLPNGRLAFTSTRDGHKTTIVFTTTASRRGTRIWSMDLDGRNVSLDSHHSLSMEEHPFPLRDGRLLYSSWQILAGVPFRHGNGSIAGPSTLGNFFPLYTQNPDGSHNFAFYGQHSGDHYPSWFGASHVAAHFVTQDRDGRVWTADYYRGNNNGLGKVVGILPESPGQEGLSPYEEGRGKADYFAPHDAIDFAPWASNGDQVSAPSVERPFLHPEYTDPIPFVGKLGHPAALPDGQLLLAYGKGPCSTVSGNGIYRALGRPAPPATSGSGQGVLLNMVSSLGMDIPACDVGVYRSTRIPSEHPTDLEIVVDSRAWHEFMARPVVPYAAIHGVERPPVIPRAERRVSHPFLEVGTPFGLLGAASLRDRETRPAGGIHFAGRAQFHLQGTDVIDFDDEEICGVRILGLMPNRGRRPHQEIANVLGERVRILGEVSVRNRRADGTPVAHEDGEPDTSFLLRMPANVPYLMQTIDCEGRLLNTDQSWQHLQPGEMKTCGGCHVHSRPEKRPFSATFAATEAYDIARLGEGRVPLLAGERDGEVQVREVEGYGLAIDFLRDVMPIFERRCVSCHGGDPPAAYPPLDRRERAEGKPSTWYCLVADARQRCIPEEMRFPTRIRESAPYALGRPQLTKYVRAFNSRGSLLYWKARGERTDNRTDETFPDDAPPADADIDYGSPHPESGITEEELGILSRWIDIGAPGGPMELRDTQRPTLHLAATVTDDAVTALHVGTVDLGEGVDPSSLEVCLLGSDGSCEDISGDAEPHGIVTIPLEAPLRDPDVEVEARVRDLAGNETVLRRTVGWLLDSPPPPPPVPPRADGGGSMSGDGGASGSDGSDGSGTLGAEGGCGCRMGSRSPLAAWPWLLLGIVWLRRRRVRVLASKAASS